MFVSVYFFVLFVSCCKLFYFSAFIAFSLDLFVLIYSRLLFFLLILFYYFSQNSELPTSSSAIFLWLIFIFSNKLISTNSNQNKHNSLFFTLRILLVSGRTSEYGSLELCSTTLREYFRKTGKLIIPLIRKWKEAKTI